MKKALLISGVAFALLLAGCASSPVALAPVGPGPFALKAAGSVTGSLIVYSRSEGRSDDGNEGGGNPEWHQHTSYLIRSGLGPKYRRVDNTIGHYEERPKTVLLAPGKYTVKAQASGGTWVEVPVVIKGGETTIVSLDRSLSLPHAPAGEVVRMPDGSAVGWRSKL